MDMLTEFQLILDVYEGKVSIKKCRIELTPENTQPNFSTPYQEGPKGREFEKPEIDNIL